MPPIRDPNEDRRLRTVKSTGRDAGAAPPPSPPQELPLSPAEKVLRVARSYKDKCIGGGANNQCAIFVRKVFREARVPVASSTNPTDMAILRRLGLGLSPDCADSFAGNDVGAKVDLSQARAGDIILYRGTDPKYPAMTITHVGIYAGGGKMIDCGGGGVIHHRAIWPISLAEIRRPHAYGPGGGQHQRYRIGFQGGRARATLDGQAVGQLELGIHGQTFSVNKAKRKVAAAKFEILQSGGTADGGSSYSVYFHHGKIGYRWNGHETPVIDPKNHRIFQIDVRYQAGGLHVWIEGTEVKPSSVDIEVVI